MSKLKKILSAFVLLIVIFISFLTGGFEQISNWIGNDYITEIESGATLIEDIDVGQGDAFLISNSDYGNILVDTGETDHADDLVSHLKNRNISKIDYIIISHPHADHIGGMCDVLDNFQVGKIYMPKMSHNTTSFKNMVSKMKEKNLYFTEAKSGVKIKLNGSDSISFISPTKDMDLDDLDNSDAVCLLKTNDRKVLFTGDIFKETELKIMNKVGKIDILKVAHHGSYKATSDEFLENTKPTYAMIGVGEDNKYSHPSTQTLNRLENFGVEIYRTDLDGNIAFIINKDGSIEVHTSK